MDSKLKIILGALFGVALISAFAYALPSSGRQDAFNWMMGGASQNAFGTGMMGGGQGSQNNGFGSGGMMGQAGNGFNFSAMHGGNAFGMMGGNRNSSMMGNGGFGMMGNFIGTGFNSSSMLSMHNLMHGTNLTSEEFANLHKGFGNASASNSSSFGCPMHSGALGDADDGDEQVGQSGNSNGMASHHSAMHGGNGFGMMGR